MPCTEAYKEHIMYTFHGFCKLIGVSEQLDRLKSDKAFLFGDGDEDARIDTGLDHSRAAESVSDAQARAVMGLPPVK